LSAVKRKMLRMEN